jgi:hypothetical protein
MTRGKQPKRRVLHLKSCSYNKLHPSPKAYCFSRIVDRRPSLVVLRPCLTPPNSACISLTLNQVHSLVHIYHRAMLVHLWASILHGDGPLLSHVVSISPVTSRTILFYLSKGTSLLTTPDNHFYWRPLLWENTITTQLWNPKVLFFLGHSIKSLDQEDRIIKCNTRRITKHHLIWQGAMLYTHERKSDIRNREVPLFKLFCHPSCSAVNVSFIVSCAPPS